MFKAILKLIKWVAITLVLVMLVARAAAWWREEPLRPAMNVALVATPLGRVAVAQYGPTTGPRIMLVHGTAAWSGFWRDEARRLGARGWRVMAVDLPPFGYSDRDPQGRYDRVSQARRLAAVIHRGGRPAVVVGHSFGAGAATELALREPARVSRLVLVDAALGALDPAPGRGAVATALSFRPLAEGVTAATIVNPWATGPMLRSFMSRKDAAAPWLDTLREPMRRDGSTSAYARWLPQLFVRDDDALSRRTANLRAIKVPVSLIWGETDTITPIAQAHNLQKLMRIRTIETLPGVGHIPHVEDPAAFRAALDRLLAGGPPKGDGG